MLKELLLYTFFIFVIYSCHHSDIYTYNCNDIGFTFSMQETDSCDVLVLNGTDTIFFSEKHYGSYAGIEFYLTDDKKQLFLGEFFPGISKIIEHNFTITRLPKPRMNEPSRHPELSIKDNSWGFYGGFERDGCYTFGVMRDTIDLGTLEPTEWSYNE